jgi:hydrolase family protein
MQLRYISVPLLVSAAGGDPWAINKSLQVGNPAEIADLAEAFLAAGRCTSEANHAFEQARSRFDAAWNHVNGDHPINDSEEVQRVVKSLGSQSLQLPKIGVDLESIAATLAEAQNSAARQITTLEGELEQLDNLIGQALCAEEEPGATPEEQKALDVLVEDCESDAIDDTKAAVGTLQSIRNGYADGLGKALSTLRTEGYDPAALHGVDADTAPEPSAQQTGQLAEIRQLANQAVVDQMGKVRAAQQALDRALADLYTHGPGSPEGEAAAAGLPKLKEDLAHALDDLGKLPDYNTIDPASVTSTPDGHFMFTYTVDGQPVQVFGQVKNGTGEFFDQATGTSYSFSGGKLTGMRTPDPGRVEARPEPLWSAITLAVGGPELKAGGEAAWQGLKTLFGREALQGLSADNVLPRALSAAEMRAAIAEESLPPRSPLPDGSGQPVPGAHAGPPPVVEHVPPTGGGAMPGEHAPAGPHVAVAPDSPPPPVVIDPGHPQFNLDNPLNYMTPELRALSEQHLTGSGETVLGPFRPTGGGLSYIDVARQHGASYFDLGQAWNSFTPTEQLAANQHILDVAIANGDKVTLSVPFYRVPPNTFTAAELQYLEAHGYRRVGDNTLIPPLKGAR